jgi:hypothetical protein
VKNILFIVFFVELGKRETHLFYDTRHAVLERVSLPLAPARHAVLERVSLPLAPAQFTIFTHRAYFTQISNKSHMFTQMAIFSHIEHISHKYQIKVTFSLKRSYLLMF